jgi:hypothetical protein
MRSGLFVVTAVALVLTSCGKNPGEPASAGVADPAFDGPRMAVAAVMDAAVDYVGTAIAVTGTVEHVCRHGGKKMFIMGDDPADRLRIETGDRISEFAVDLEGSDVVVQGVIVEDKIDDAYLDTWEAELKDPGTDGGAGKGAEAGEHHDDIPTQIATFRMIIADNDGEPISFYHLECDSFTELN